MSGLIKLVLVGLISALTLSCDDGQPLFVNCDDCFQEKPKFHAVRLKLTINPENPFVPVTVYYGNIEDNQIAFRDTLTNEVSRRVLEVGHSYSVEAQYWSKGRRVIAVDGKSLKSKLDNDSCDEPCYYITGDTFNLRLKY